LWSPISVRVPVTRPRISAPGCVLGMTRCQCGQEGYRDQQAYQSVNGP
jgi:hypothetical protein